MNPNLPIALFDSGVGGLTVFRELKALLPHEKMIYYADTLNFPFGDQSPEKIQEITLRAALFLQQLPVKMIVIACHTASSYAAQVLQQQLSIPVVGMKEGTIRSLKDLSPTSRVALLATPATIQHRALQNTLVERYSELTLIPISCPLFAKAIQAGALPSLEPLKGVKVDAVLLACTHFPMIKEAIEKELGSLVIDPAREVCQIVHEILRSKHLLGNCFNPTHQLYVTGEVDRFTMQLKETDSFDKVCLRG